MDRGSIPDDEELAGDLAQEHAQKPDHIRAVVGRGLCLPHQALVLGEGGDRRALISGQGDSQDWGVPVPCPRPDVMGKQREP